MNEPDPEKLRSAAAEVAQRLLHRRLKRAGLATARPELYVQTESDPPVPFEGGFEVRVKIWRHWSDARLAQDGLSPPALTREELLAWTIDRRSDPPHEVSPDNAAMFEAVKAKMKLPQGAVPDSVQSLDFSKGRKLVQVRWSHEHAGMPVVNDHFTVLIHPVTMVIVGVDQRWTGIA